MGNQIEFIGFADDCRVEGRVDLEDARLADLLNRKETLVLRHVTLVSMADGHSRQFRRLEIQRDELDIVVATGPRGDPSRRLATRPSGVALKLGPYQAEGYMHAPPTATVRGLNHRPSMVALTDAVLEYSFNNETHSQRYETLLVNRDLADSLRTVISPAGTYSGAA